MHLFEFISGLIDLLTLPGSLRKGEKKATEEAKLAYNQSDEAKRLAKLETAVRKLNDTETNAHKPS